MKPDNQRAKMSYYRTLYSKYAVDDSCLHTRPQRRAIGQFLDRLEKRALVHDDTIPKGDIKRLGRAFVRTPLARHITTALTVITLLTLFQSPPVAAGDHAKRSSQPVSAITLQESVNQIMLDEDSDLPLVSENDPPHKSALHFVSSKATNNPLPTSQKGVIQLDTDSDILPQNEQGKTLTVIDTSMEEWETLYQAIAHGDILLLDHKEDPIDAIVSRLKEVGPVETLSILSHGAQGALYLGGQSFSVNDLEERQDQWRQLGDLLTESGDIQLFGCHIAAGETGKTFITKLADLTSADVAASINPTGNLETGGDWVLEAVHGDVAPHELFDTAALSPYEGILVWSGTIDFSEIRDAGAYQGAASIDAQVYTDAGQTYTLVGDAQTFSTDITNTHLYASNGETQLTLSFLNNEFFNVSSITIHNCVGSTRIYSITSDQGDSFTTPQFSDLQTTAISLSNFTGITSLTITNNAGGTVDCLYVDDMVVTNVQGNNPPALGGSFTTAGSVNDNATILPFSSVTVSDADGDTVSVSITYTGANGALSGTGLTGSAGSYTLSSAAPATVTTNLQGLVFTPTENQVAAGTTVDTSFTLTPNDGTADGSADATTQVTATSINDNPTITSNGGGASGATSINENSAAATTVTATDADPSTTFTYSISGGVDAAAFSINSTSGALTFSSAPNYESPTDTGTNNVYDVQVTVTDDGPGTLTDVQDLAITVNNINENPLITSDGGGASAAVNAAENQTAVTTVAGFDSDVGDTLSYSISGGLDAALFSINGTSGVLTFNAPPNFETPTDNGSNGVYDVQVTVTDDGAGNLTDTQAIAVTVTNTNESPSITSNGGGASGAVTINENTTAVTTVTETDPDTGDSHTFSISGGADAAAFSINSTTGVLTLNNAADFETPVDSGNNNTYDVQVTVTDDGAGNLSDTQDLTVTIDNVNENPVITSDGGGASASVNAAENQTTVTTVTATDEDSGDTLSYAISGGVDAAQFSINPSSGVVTFNSAPDFEAPTDSGANNVYDIEVTVTDNGTGNLTDVQTIAITVTSGNDNPVITSNGGGATGAVTIDENTTAVTTVTATDPDVGDTLTFSISGGVDAARFTIDGASGALTFSSAADFETPLDSGADNVYDLRVTVTDDGLGNLTDQQELSVTINNVNENPVITSNGGGATASINTAENQSSVTTITATDQDSADTLTFTLSGGVDAGLFTLNASTGALSFTNPPSFSAPADNGANNVYDIQVTVTDDGAGNLTDQQAIAITVTDVSSPPGGSLTISGTAEEDQTLTAINNITDADGLGSFSYQWLRDGSAISGATSNSYTLGDDDVGHALSVTASYTDGGGTLESVTSSATSPVANVNDTPSGTVTINGEAAEGQLLSADTSTISDIDGLGDFSYLWTSGSSELQESSGSYLLTADDVGNQITLTVSYTDGQGTVEVISSLPTEAVIGTTSDAPVVVAPEDITVNATGLFTEIDVGAATATDPDDGELTPTVTQIVSNGVGPTPLAGTPVYFSPGNHQLSWSATDSDDNASVATQNIHVVPMVSFSKNQVSAEGETAQFKVILNGPAVEYPVTVPYTLSGTMLHDGSDHDLIDGSVTITSPDLETSVSVSFVNDGANEGAETLIISMGTPENAVTGPIAAHQIEILESNVAPSAELIADQNGVITRLIGQTDGPVIVMATITDPNQQDEHSYDWSGSDNRLIDLDSEPTQLSFDPTNLEPDTYRIKLTVNDGTAEGDAELLLNLVPSLPELSEEDSDNDGIDDSEEGTGDSDSDGIPDYLDHLDTARNVIQEQQGDSQEFLMETEPGLEFLLGDVAFRAHGESTSVSAADIENHGNDGEGANADEEKYEYPGGLFDFRIDKLPIAGQSVSLVIPQFAPIPDNAVYRKLMPTGWQDFVIDEQNRIASSAGTAGYCPPPGDVTYIEGLTSGHWCVQLTIEDGGPNDGDQLINSSVEDPGGVTQRAAESTGKSKSGGGTTSLLSLLLFFLLFHIRQLYMLGKNRSR